MVKGLESRSYEELLKDLDVGCYTEKGVDSFYIAYKCRAITSKLKPQRNMFRLDITGTS